MSDSYILDRYIVT